jgi:hypothetical protein
MTITEFNKTKWHSKMQCEYDGNIYEIGSINFKESLIGLVEDDEEVQCVRCENVDLI